VKTCVAFSQNTAFYSHFRPPFTHTFDRFDRLLLTLSNRNTLILKGFSGPKSIKREKYKKTEDRRQQRFAGIPLTCPPPLLSAGLRVRRVALQGGMEPTRRRFKNAS
jgi:hypothetical protein